MDALDFKFVSAKLCLTPGMRSTVFLSTLTGVPMSVQKHQREMQVGLVPTK